MDYHDDGIKTTFEPCLSIFIVAIFARGTKMAITMKLPFVSTLLYFLSFAHVAESTSLNSSTPSVTVKNGTYIGKFVSEWQQDQFLGIPFAIPPLGPLRFAWPQSLNSSFTGVKKAIQYGYSCMQYGSNFSLSEDCLTLNGKPHNIHFIRNMDTNLLKVIRPSGTKSTNKLPVLVWIYGGGLYAGSTADPQYNVSGIAHVGQEIEKPVIVGLHFPLSSTEIRR